MSVRLAADFVSYCLRQIDGPNLRPALMGQRRARMLFCRSQARLFADQGLN
jgi:hypothetical protein